MGSSFWGREGNQPCLKGWGSAGAWREALGNLLEEKERSAKFVGQFGSFLWVPDNVLAIAQNLSLPHRVDASFFGVGRARSGLLVKFYGGEESPPKELIARFEENGLTAGRLQQVGRLLRRFEGHFVGGWGIGFARLVEEGVGEGRVVLASLD